METGWEGISVEAGGIWGRQAGRAFLLVQEGPTEVMTFSPDCRGVLKINSGRQAETGWVWQGPGNGAYRAV